MSGPQTEAGRHLVALMLRMSHVDAPDRDLSDRVVAIEREAAEIEASRYSDPIDPSVWKDEPPSRFGVWVDLASPEAAEGLARAMHDQEYHPCTGDYASCVALGEPVPSWRDCATTLLAAWREARS